MGGHEVGFGFWDEPVWEGWGHVGVFLVGTIGQRMSLTCKTSSRGFPGRAETYAVDEIVYDPHRNAKLLKVQIAVIVDVGEVPDPLELVVAQLAVFENGGCLGTGQVGTAVG